MKKIGVSLLLILAVAGCGKIESGTITIQNNSTYNVTCGVGENWTVKHYDIPAGHTKQVDWKSYVLVWNETPKNIVTCKRSGSTAVLENNKPSHIVYIKNKTDQQITINDKVKTYDGKDIPDYALADNADNNKYVDTLNIPASSEKEYAFYFSLRAENFQHSSMIGCAASFTTDTVVRGGLPVTRQVIELTK